MITSRLSLTIGIATMLALSGCAMVSQPVFKVPENNDCTESGIKKGICKKFDGVPYVLPRTALKITIPVVETIETEGSFVSEARKIFANEKRNKCKWNKEDKNKCSDADNAAFMAEFSSDACIQKVSAAADELGIKIAVHETYGGAQSTSNELGDISMISEAIPDPAQLYFVEVKGHMFERRSMDITFAAGGILNEITASAEDKTAEFAAKTLGSVLGAAAKFGGYAISAETTAAKDTAHVCTSSKSIYKNLVSRAFVGLKYIQDFPNARNVQLTGGNTAVTKDNLELRLKELDADYNTALAMFKGNKKAKSETYEVTLLPKSNGSDIPLATFSESCGLYRTVQPNETMPSTTVPLSNKDACKSTDAPNIKAFLSTPLHMAGTSLPTRISDSLDSGTNTRGIYYRVPGTSRITIKNDTDELLAKDVAIAQFGEIASLPAQTGSSNVTYKVTLDPVTGMLLKVSISSEEASTDTGKNFIDPVGDYLKARKDSKDELTQLQREESILKAKKSIKELQDALAQ